MKFTDGFWLVRKGYTVNSAMEAYDACEHEGALEVYAPTHQDCHAGRYLGRTRTQLSRVGTCS